MNLRDEVAALGRIALDEALNAPAAPRGRPRNDLAPHVGCPYLKPWMGGTAQET